MYQATPFDLCLFTGMGLQSVDEIQSQRENARLLFAWCRNQFVDSNRRFAQNPVLSHYRLCIPMTKDLFEQITNTPSWHEITGIRALYDLKALILKFLYTNEFDGGSPIAHIDRDNEYCYLVIQPNDYFLDEMADELCQAWEESTGICSFGRARESGTRELIAVSSTWVVSPGRGLNKIQMSLRAESIQEGIPNEEKAIDLLCLPETWPIEGDPDFWPWELCVRKALWNDPRLPYLGPNGAFGFYPHPGLNWMPGQQLTQENIGGCLGYKDIYGGLWQWEGGRAHTGTLFDGHWNVQLPTRQAIQRWVRHIQTILGISIHLRSNHINIETDGRIVDTTFDII